MNAEQSLSLLTEFGIDTAYHVTPLHYIPFIGRSQFLLSRAQLKLEGFSDSHFRSTSHRADLQRGFGDRIYLSPYRSPPILEAKLRKGFPHVRVDIPISALKSAGGLGQLEVLAHQERDPGDCRVGRLQPGAGRRGAKPGWWEPRPRFCSANILDEGGKVRKDRGDQVLRLVQGPASGKTGRGLCCELD